MLSKVKKLNTAWGLLRSGDWPGVAERLQKYHLDRFVPHAEGKFPPQADLQLTTKEKFSYKAERDFDTFLLGSSKIRFPEHEAPEVTVVLIFYNKAELSYLCLRSLAALVPTSRPFRILIIDNASRDNTNQLIDRLEGVQAVINDENVGFVRACNQARELITTPYTLFLNNDTIVHQGSIDAALEVFEEEEHVGAVGGRIILTDGALQEAGNFIWRDGTCNAYGRGCDPTNGEFMFRRQTDYCSGAFLLTPTDVLNKLEGFDDAYAPAYYEETDYCVRVAKAGLRVFYEPRVTIEHVEFGSAAISSAAIKQMEKSRSIFENKHRDYLATKSPMLEPTDPALLKLRREYEPKRDAVLVIDDRAPHPYIGAGFPRAQQILLALHERGYEISYFPTLVPAEYWSHIYQTLPKDVEFCANYGFVKLKQFLQTRLDHYKMIWISRPHNMFYMMDFMRPLLEEFKGKIIYDAEALFSARDKLEKEKRGKVSKQIYRSRKYAETDAAGFADAVISVAEYEAEIFRRQCSKPVFVVGHNCEYHPTDAGFAERKDFVFFGSMHGHPSPNSDSAVWFLENVWPQVKAQIPDAKFHFLGYNEIEKHKVFNPYRKDLVFVGKVDDLGPHFNKYRVLVIPTRFAAGIPQKTFDAAAYGIPSVCSQLIADQMEWRDGKECLAASTDDPQRYAELCIKLYQEQSVWDSVRHEALEYMRSRQETHSIKKQVDHVIDSLLKDSR